MPNKSRRASADQRLTGLARTAAPSTSGHGAAIPASWRTLLDGKPPEEYMLRLGGDAAATLTGATLWFYFTDLAYWTNVGALNGGTAITITGAAQDYSEVVRKLGMADRVAVVGTWSAGTGAVTAEPILGDG